MADDLKRVYRLLQQTADMRERLCQKTVWSDNDWTNWETIDEGIDNIHTHLMGATGLSSGQLHDAAF